MKTIRSRECSFDCKSRVTRYFGFVIYISAQSDAYAVERKLHSGQLGGRAVFRSLV